MTKPQRHVGASVNFLNPRSGAVGMKGVIVCISMTEMARPYIVDWEDGTRTYEDRIHLKPLNGKV